MAKNAKQFALVYSLECGILVLQMLHYVSGKYDGIPNPIDYVERLQTNR